MHRQVGDQAASDSWVTGRLDLSLSPWDSQFHSHSSTRDPVAIAEDAGERERPQFQCILQLDEEFQISHVPSKRPIQTVSQSVA